MMTRLKSVSLTALSALAFYGVGHAQAPANPDPSAVHGGAYTVEPQHTQVIFKVSHLGFSTYYGDFTNASGTLRLDPRDAAVDSLDVTIPVDSVATTSGKLTEELKSADWFDAAKYPTMHFHSRHVTVTGPGRARVEGELTLHGVTLPVTLEARFNGAGVNPLDKAYTVGFEVSGHIKRSAFGVNKYVPLVGDDVELIISAAFEHAPS